MLLAITTTHRPATDLGFLLAALRYPERDLVSVPAGRTYAEPVRPLSPPATPPEAYNLLDIEDVSGKRVVTTALMSAITIREENAAAGIEVTSRFCIDPRRLIYLPPTMSPSETSQAGPGARKRADRPQIVTMTHPKIVTVSGDPSLAPVVAKWLVETFFNYPGSYTVEEMTALILAPSDNPKETFVLFDDDRPVGTAAMIPADLDARPDLTPWLAGLFVEPGFRGRGHAKALVRQVESFAASVAVPVLWLYTLGAEAFYARLGWIRAGLEEDRGKPVVLMKRVL